MSELLRKESVVVAVHESASVTGIFGTPATATAIWWYRRSVDLANLKRMGLLKCRASIWIEHGLSVAADDSH